MKCIVIYSHPNPKSFCHAILETVTHCLKDKKHEVEIRDLYSIGFDPVLKGSDFATFQAGQVPEDIKKEQDFIKRADCLIMIHPVWWTGLPAMIKGYIDRVLSYGFAYSVDGQGVHGLLTGKKVLCFNTQGTPEGVYESSGMWDAMKMTSDKGIYQFCGLKVVQHVFFPGVPTVSNDVRKGYLEKVKEIVNLIG